MKLIENHKFKLSAVTMALALVSGCGAELDQAGINTETVENIEPIIYLSETGFKRLAREVTDASGNVSLEY